VADPRELGCRPQRPKCILWRPVRIGLTAPFKLIVEGINLTDEQNRLYIDSTRQDTLFQTRVGRSTQWASTRASDLTRSSQVGCETFAASRTLFFFGC
jgi:hypothetical protein